ncbi:hypothetical protein BJY04DRAFT_199300 [Aspergillus karnatakaensis]|uniref:uncharacterized protein n=1 Tax=Aspergillus karnatakaensis TaxID=1810916 RepID=UPI003CCE3803
MRPTQTEPRLPGPLGGPHKLFDGSFILEFLQPGPELDASVLMRATYVGGHEHTKQGKKHPQAPPLHLHFSQSESFIIEAGAIGTTTTWGTIDTIHTTKVNHIQGTPSPKLNPPVPYRTAEEVTEIPPWTPHNFWPVSPDHPFWTTPEGQQYEATLPNGRNSDSTLLIWGHPRTTNGPPSGKLTSDFPPDMDAAFFLALLGLVDGISSKRVDMTAGLGVKLMGLQTASASSMLICPTASWMGPLRWMVPWYAQVSLEWTRRLFRGQNIVKFVEEVIEEQVVKRE